ncbi:uncharacterized protein LOC106476233, partial [Limulus polyphemus]|uniref:Uncharacterized protein LOC106476233 n=1 Tax=Limulus polyphemus TaxID=6850 RepID=A0ABM1RWW7_LIMPO
YHRASNDCACFLSSLYAKLLVVAALVLLVTEFLPNRIPLLFFQGYLLSYLLGGAVLFLVNVYVILAVKKLLRKNSTPSISRDNHVPDSLNRGPIYASNVSIYLRIGVLVFGTGNLVFLGMEAAALFSTKTSCVGQLTLLQPILQGVFTLLQMHFLLINVKIIIKSLGWLRHVIIMHLIVANLIVWFQLIIRETAREWQMVDHVTIQSTSEYPLHTHTVTVHTFDEKGAHQVFTSPVCRWQELKPSNKEETMALFDCIKNSTAGDVWWKASPFLHPFLIQYSLLAAMICHFFWANIDYTNQDGEYEVFKVSNTNTSPFWKVDCQKAYVGLFSGILLLIATLVILIIVLLPESHGIIGFDSLLTLAIFHCAILGFSVIVIFVGLIQIRQLRPELWKNTGTNGLFLHIGILAVHAYGILTLIVGGSKLNSKYHLISCIDGALLLLHSCLQSLFIHQMERSSCGGEEQLKQKRPGREIVTFLALSNGALWAVETFTSQNHLTSQLQLEFYGVIPWGIFSRVLIPLVSYYRFQCFVVLMDASKYTYKHNRG